VQLIDRLEERAEKVLIEETPEKVRAEYINGQWHLYLDDALAPVTKNAMDTLLNLLRIPIRYIDRCIDGQGVFLAESSINYWIEKHGKLSFLTEYLDDEADYPAVTQVFSEKRIYIPGVRVNDLIVEKLGDCNIHSFSIEDDIYNAVYLLDEEVTINGDPYQIGVRVLYSDCFTITPRFDGVLYEKHFGGMLTWPTLGRKFRVAQNTVSQIIEQIQEFVDLSLNGLKENVVPALEGFDNSLLVDAEKFITRLCNDLRLNKKVRAELLAECTLTPNHFPLELIVSISAYAAKGEYENLDTAMAREIQLALSNYVVKGSFK
jgi:hypothetical protein